MKAQTLASWLVCSLGAAMAAPYAANISFDPQKAASRQLSFWQEDLNVYVAKSLQARQAAANGTAPSCTADKIVYRREW
jgi:hypothetical protein